MMKRFSTGIGESVPPLDSEFDNNLTQSLEGPTLEMSNDLT